MSRVRKVRWHWKLDLIPLQTGEWQAIDPYVRCRRLLKFALRSCGFRCKSVKIYRRETVRQKGRPAKPRAVQAA